MRAQPWNMALRMAMLASRFLFTIYLAHSLSIADLGAFGFVMGLVGIIPPLTGWGVNYYLGREVVGRTLDDAALIVRDRLAITLASLLAITPLVPLFMVFDPALPFTRLFLVVGVIVTETLAADLHTPLVSLGMSLFANVLLFVRSALWITLFVLISTVYPVYRTLDTALSFWLVFNVIQFGLLHIVVLRRIDFSALFSVPLHLGQSMARIRRAVWIFANDVGNAGVIYFDRYVIAGVLGLHDLGIYTLYWSLASGVNALITSGIIQPATPVLVHAHAIQSRVVSDRLLARTLMNAAASALVLSAGVVLAAFVALTYLHIGDFAQNYPLLLLLLGASTIRSLSDVVSLGLASRHMDRAYATAGMGGMLLAIPLNIAGMSMYGLLGAAIAACCTHSTVAIGKWTMLRMSSDRSVSLKNSG